MRRIIIACGGTGGHISPGIAILEELLKNKEHFQVSSIQLHSPKRNKDNPDLQNLPVEIIWHNLPQFKLTNAIIFPFLFFYQMLKTYFHFKKREINTVIGMGGYTSLLSVVYTKLSKSSLFLCEQNCIPGKITRKFWKHAEKIACSFSLSESFSPPSDNFKILGNPLRSSVLPKTPGLKNQIFSDKNPVNVLVMGGSQGARQINHMVLEAMENKEIGRFFKFRVLTGTNLYEEVKKKSQDVEAISYSRDMGTHYEWADLVIGRSGAGVLAECSAYALPMILIPYPYAADNHQKANAEYFGNQGASIVIDTNTMDSNFLIKELYKLRDNPKLILEMAIISLGLARINASRDTLNYFFHEAH
jgi:UDP-N-acetylglucosamine--N-acetylmuramyl-(pentapeptide) pyrophosphoryl-undecaprenol N-acetylglucosamine transferase